MRPCHGKKNKWNKYSHQTKRLEREAGHSSDYWWLYRAVSPADTGCKQEQGGWCHPPFLLCTGEVKSKRKNVHRAHQRDQLSKPAKSCRVTQNGETSNLITALAGTEGRKGTTHSLRNKKIKYLHEQSPCSPLQNLTIITLEPQLPGPTKRLRWQAQSKSWELGHMTHMPSQPGP